MRWREFLIPTTKETPKEAATPSHVLMLRAGLLRPVASGVHAYLPLGWRVLRKIEAIVRKELVHAGAIEVHLPALQPLAWAEAMGNVADPCEASLRLAGPPDDWRSHLALAPTHAAAMTALAKAYLKSYKQLPITLFHVGVALRGEERPAGGALRTRESLAAEAFLFHADRDSLDAGYQTMRDACERVLSRCGLPYVMCDGEPGPRGGVAAHAFMVPCDAGDDRVAIADRGDYAADARWARSADPDPAPDVEIEPLREMHTPGAGRVEDVCAMLGTQPAQMIKTLVYTATRLPSEAAMKGAVVAGPRTGRGPSEPVRVIALVRGDHEVNEYKLSKLAGATLELAEARTIEKLTGAEVGFAGPHGLAGRVTKLIIDPHVVAMRNAGSGANRTDYHLIGLNPGRDFPLSGDNITVADIRGVTDGDPSPADGVPLRIRRAIAVGRLAKLGSRYSRPINATFLSSDGKRRHFVMGRCAMSLARMVAAVIETHHDENGIIWPMAIAPFQVLILALDPRDQQVMKTAAMLHDKLTAAGLDVLLDDRDERAGFKFHDADLIGIPLRIIVGKRSLASGGVEVNQRQDRERLPLAPAAAIEHVGRLVNEGLVVPRDQSGVGS